MPAAAPQLFFSLHLNVLAAPGADTASAQAEAPAPFMLAAVASHVPCDYMLMGIQVGRDEALACLVQVRPPRGNISMEAVASHVCEVYTPGLRLALSARQVHWAVLDRRDQFSAQSADASAWLPIRPARHSQQGWARFLSGSEDNAAPILRAAHLLRACHAGAAHNGDSEEPQHQAARD